MIDKTELTRLKAEAEAAEAAWDAAEAAEAAWEAAREANAAWDAAWDAAIAAQNKAREARQKAKRKK